MTFGGERKKPQMRSYKWRRMFAELRPNSHMLPSRTEPNIQPNSSAELRRLPNFGPSLMQDRRVATTLCYNVPKFGA